MHVSSSHDPCIEQLRVVLTEAVGKSPPIVSAHIPILCVWVCSVVQRPQSVRQACICVFATMSTLRSAVMPCMHGTTTASPPSLKLSPSSSIERVQLGQLLMTRGGGEGGKGGLGGQAASLPPRAAAHSSANSSRHFGTAMLLVATSIVRPSDEARALAM